AISDFTHPDRVVIGTESERAKEVMRELYRPISLIEAPIVFTSRVSSELIKYAANTFLATKITFINEIADLCEKVNADVYDVSRGIGLDGRIGKKFLHAGPGYGGSCFPKDTMALVHTARDVGAPLSIVEAVVEVNSKRKIAMVDRVINACGGSLKGKTVAVLGLTFKPNTDDMRDSPSLDIVPAMVSQGATVRAYDPEGMAEAKTMMDGIEWCDETYSTMENADVLVIITEWNAFRGLDLTRVKEAMKTPIMVDLRNIYEPSEMFDAGFEYYCIGRPWVSGKSK
ncbi:MAG: UDP-glucose/GDP-mannose dehydrogenase family protein, partial [Rhodospirillaceae bacterium]|nr:UDP-glucose/GDP-mannose dehydrogenase family protein [Rhodospirillaceae bacterium]